MPRRRFTTDNTYRSCSRCQKELTDPASRECGVGPVCRRKDNHLYAKVIEANIPMASALILGTYENQLPSEVAEEWNTLKETFTRKMLKAQGSNDDPSVMKLTGSDFRDEVHIIDYILSYRCGGAVRDSLICMVRFLGYVGLASVLDGTASKSKATVWFENGRILLKGTGCTPGFYKMKKLRGIRVPKYRGDHNPYSAPASETAAFLNIVREHWPLYEGDIDLLTTQANAWAKGNPESTPEAPSGPTAVIKGRSSDFVLSFPWSNDLDVRGMIAKLKRIPSKERAYNPATKNWMFRKNHLKEVLNICYGTFGKKSTMVLETSEETPASEWKKTNPYPNRGRGRGWNYNRSDYYRGTW